MKRLYKALILFLCFIICVPEAFASGTETSAICEIYSVEFKNSSAVIRGRAYADAGSEITLIAVKQPDGAASAAASAECLADGSFEIEFEAEPVAYDISINVSGKVFETVFDFSGLGEVFNISGFSVSGICFETDAITIKGTHSQEVGAEIGFKIIDESKTGIEAVKAVNQATVDSSNGFEIKFLTGTGTYKMYLDTNATDTVSAILSISDFELSEKDNADIILQKLTAYESNLAVKIAECDRLGLSTDYENANRAIIKQFIENINFELENGDSSRLGQYDYVLTKLYTEAHDNLNKYLSGEKTPFDVPKYKTGEIRIDGKTVYATTELNGKTEERPVFFVGYGHWDTAFEDMPFLKEIGSNITTTSIYTEDVVKSYNAEDWEFGVLSANADREMTIKVTSAEKASGGYSAMMTAKGSNDEAFSRLLQYFDVKPNTTYEVGLKAKGDGATVWVSIEGLADAGRSRMYLKNTSDWTEYSLEYTTGETPVGLFNMYSDGADVTTALYIDDIYVREKGSDINLIKNAGFETAGRELSENETAAAEHGWYIDRNEFKRLQAALESAEEMDMLVSGGVGTTTIPDFIRASDPDMSTASSHFLPYLLDNETVRDFLSIYGRICVDAQIGYKSVYDMCLMNEPKVHVNDGSYNNGTTPYQQRWADYLENKYGNVYTLYTKYGKWYSSFEDVEMPNGVEKNLKYYDYRSFNDEVLSEFINWYVDELQSEYPQFKYHVKMMQYLRYNYPNYFRDGTNFELIADNVDLNGCDGYGSPDDSNLPLTLKMAWYDMLTSLSDKPVWDTENHILSDKAVVDYDAILPAYVGADIWNGAVHGRGASINWTWDQSRQSQPWGNSQFVNTNFVFRPEEVAEVSKVTLDLNRLSNEIATILQEEAKVAILYSRASIGYNDNHMAQVADAYEQTIFSGQKAGFITDSNSADVSKYELLIVPEATNVTAEVFDNIYNFVLSGGKVLLTGDNSLKYDESNTAHNSTKVNYIYNNAEIGTVAEAIDAMELTEVVLRDAETGEKLDNVEWSYAKYNGQYVVNILNHDMEHSKKIKVLCNDKEIAELTELRSGTNASQLVAEPMQAMLVAFDIPTFTFDLINENGEVIKADISTLETGKIKCTSNVGGNLILALYKGDLLVDISIGTGVIKFSPNADGGSYRLMATAWNKDNIEPLARSRNLTNAE